MTDIAAFCFDPPNNLIVFVWHRRRDPYLYLRKFLTIGILAADNQICIHNLRMLESVCKRSCPHRCKSYIPISFMQHFV